MTNAAGTRAAQDVWTPSRRGRLVIQAVALVLGVVTGFVSYVIKADLELSIWLGIAVALGMLIVETTSTMVSLTRAVADVNARLDSFSLALDSRDSFSGAMAHIRGGGDLGRRLAHTVEQLNTSLVKVPTSLLGVANEVLRESAEAVHACHLVVPGNSASLGSHLVRRFEKSVFTTSFHPLDFWLTPYGRNYHTEICERLKVLSARSRVEFRRVFIVRSDVADELTKDPYQKLIREQLRCGVEVRVCNEDELPTELCVDFGLWDGELEIELECDQQRRVIRNHYRYSQEAITQAQNRADRIWDRASPYDKWTAARQATRQS